MSNLNGVSILNNTFVQDTNTNWLKINNVCIGESSIYGYYTINSNGDIGGLLNTLSQDKNVTCVVYNWSNNTAYIKTGFNLSVQSDYKLTTGFTSFVLKSKIPIYYPSSITPITPITPFVKWTSSQGNFMLNGKNFVPVGFNAYWLGYTEQYNYPTNVQIDEMFNVAVKINATVIRSHTLGISSGSSGSLRPYNNVLNNNAWKPIDYAFYKAKQTGIKLICALTDSYSWYNGSYGDFCKTRGIDKSKFWTDYNVRNDFKQYISDWLNHTNSYTGVQIKNSPEIFSIELGNEIGNIRQDATSTTIPTQEWLTDISNYIKTLDNNHILMAGTDECLGSTTSNDFNINSIDMFSAHFYGQDYSRIDYGANKSSSIGKPYIIGEYSSQFQNDWFNNIEMRPNVKGTVAWSFYCHDNGLPTGNRVIHNDGFSVYGDNQDSKNTQQLLLLTNHFRRMRGLQAINQLYW